MKRDTHNKEQVNNVVQVRGSKEAEENNKRVQAELKRKNRLIVTVIVVAVFILLISMIGVANKEYKGYKVESRVDTSYENTASYIQFGDDLLKYTPDGVSYINENGDTVWTAGVDMKMPIAVTSGRYAVVADMSGNEVYVFSDEGQISNLTMPYTICDVDVANQGAFAVVLESDETNYINLYDKQGKIVYEMQTTIGKSGYPLDIAISDNGQKLFTSYINVGANAVLNNLAAYNFGDVGQNANADRMVGGYKFENEIIPRIEFVDNDTVVAFGTNTITIYSMKEKPSERAKISMDKEARSVFHCDKYIGIVQERTDNEDGVSYDLIVYDVRGKKKFSHRVDFAYDNIYAAGKEIIVTGGDRCLILRANGSVKFDGKLSGSICCMVPSGKRNQYVVVYDNATEIIKLGSDSGNKKAEE